MIFHKNTVYLHQSSQAGNSQKKQNMRERTFVFGAQRVPYPIAMYATIYQLTTL